MKALRRLFFKIFPVYRRLELRYCTWSEGDALIKSESGWRIADEDTHLGYPHVALEKVERITE